MQVLTTRVITDNGVFIQGSILTECDVNGKEAYETNNPERFQAALEAINGSAFGVYDDGVDIPGHNVPFTDEGVKEDGVIYDELGDVYEPPTDPFDIAMEEERERETAEWMEKHNIEPIDLD